MFVDYFYNVAGPDSAASPGAREGMHGFRYRRLYLTSDFQLSDDFSGRARLEADENTRPFVKDLALTWNYTGAHSATLGITPPPVFAVANGFWGYRALDKTLVDLQDIADSRDFGLRFDGPLIGEETLQYAVMVANNSGIQAETNTQKRVYGQLQTTLDSFTFVVGSDYAEYGDQRDYGTRFSVFGGYETGWGRIGVEGYWYRLAFEGAGERTDLGASLFGVVEVAPSWELIARVDRSAERRVGADRYETFLLGGVSYRPHSNVLLIPNLRMRDLSSQEVETTGRFTVRVQF